jgi:hypothetical protein
LQAEHRPLREQSRSVPDWQRDLRIKIAWAMAVKLAGLLLLWWLFFRSTHS